LLWTLATVLALIGIQNTASVQARFLWLTAEVPVFVLLFFAVTGASLQDCW